MALQGGAIIVTALVQAKASLEAIELNNSVSRTLLCVLCSLESLLQDLDHATREKNSEALAELEGLVQEIIHVGDTIERRRQRRTPYARLCRVLLSRSVYVKLTSLLHRMNALVNTLHLSSFVQEQQRKRCLEEVASTQADAAGVRSEQGQHVSEIKQAMATFESSVGGTGTRAQGEQSPLKSMILADSDSHTSGFFKGESRSGRRGVGDSSSLDEAAMGLVFEKAKHALEKGDVQSSALDELTSVVLFLEECEQADIKSEDLRFGKLLGKGGFGYVMEASWNGTPVAVKVIQSFVGNAPLSVDSMREFANELRMWKVLKHPNVVQLLGTSFHKQDRLMCFVMELCEKSLSDVIHNEKGTTEIDTGFIQSIGCDVARGLQYLHARSILHRDIKPRNVLLVPGKNYPRGKLCDFGMTLAKEETATRTVGNAVQGGTLAYMSPETLTKPSYLGEKSDVYAFGVLLWEMVERQKPFNGQNAAVVLACAFQGQRLAYVRRPSLESWVYDILDVAWKQERGERPTAAELVQYFEAKAVKSAPATVFKTAADLTLKNSVRDTVEEAKSVAHEDTSISTEVSAAFQGAMKGATAKPGTEPRKATVDLEKEVRPEEAGTTSSKRMPLIAWVRITYPKTCCVLVVFMLAALGLVLAFACLSGDLCGDTNGQERELNGTSAGLKGGLTEAPTIFVPQTLAPSILTSNTPTNAPSTLEVPSSVSPTTRSTRAPSTVPTTSPSRNPSAAPSLAPTFSSSPPTISPSLTSSTSPTLQPSEITTVSPTARSDNPTGAPSIRTAGPTFGTESPSVGPTLGTVAPTFGAVETRSPTLSPSVLSQTELMARCFQHVGRFCEHKNSNKPLVVCNDNRKVGRCTALECRTQCFQNTACSAYQYGDDDAKASYRFRCELHVQENVTEGRDQARPVRCYTRRWNVAGCIPSS